MLVRHTTKLAVWAVVDLRPRALLAGCGLGWVTRELSLNGADAAQTLPIALLFLLSASASFVLHALHLRTVAVGRAVQRPGVDARRCIVWLGAGIAASLQALQLLFG